MNIGIVGLLSIIVFFIGFYGLITSNNIIKSIAAIGLLEVAVVMFYLGIGFATDMAPPIGEHLEHVADPLPQALMITTIIIGVTVSAVCLAMMITLCKQLKVADWDVLIKKSTE
jgi:multicomponent Na+:H+ antiporter subunit C